MYSESVNVIDAKWKVFKEYEQLLEREQIILQHEFEEYDETCKTIGVRLLQNVQSMIVMLKDAIPDDFELEMILERAVERALSCEKIRELCYEVDLWDNNNHIGTTSSSPYVCFSHISVQRIKLKLVEQTMETIIRTMLLEICRQTNAKYKESIDAEVYHLLTFDSDELFGNLVIHPCIIVNVLISQYQVLLQIVTFFISSVDVNSIIWRQRVADEIFQCACGIKENIIRKLSSIFKIRCETTKDDFEKLANKILDWEEYIPLINQETCKFIWRKGGILFCISLSVCRPSISFDIFA